MANNDSPRGFIAFRHHGGGIIRPNEYPIASGYATGIAKNDVVKLAADGSIQLAAAGNRFLGVFQGCSYVDAQGNVVYSKQWPASQVATDIKAMVIDDPMVSYIVQEASGGTGPAADVGTLADHVATAGDTATGMSRMELSSTHSTAEAGFRILGIAAEPSNAAGENVNYIVLPFEHEFSAAYAHADFDGTPGV